LAEIVKFIITALLLLWRRVRYGYAYRRIKLTQGQYAIVDARFYRELNKYKWYAHKGKTTYYAYRAARVNEKRKSKNIKMHNEIIRQKTVDRGPKTENGKRLIVDHINGNGLDNRIANLRLATYAQNSRNRSKIKRACSSRYKGVWYSRKLNKWRAQICYGGVKEHLGYYRDERDAARAYDAAARRHHDKFARVNI